MIEKIIQKVGDFCSWLSFALVILITLDVFLRYIFNFSSASLYELEWHFFAIIFLLGSSITLQKDEHVRVDILYRNSKPQYKKLVNTLGIIFFLFPTIGVLAYYSIDFVSTSWSVKEISTEPGGLKFVYLQKSLIFLFPIVLAFAGLKELYKLWK